MRSIIIGTAGHIDHGKSALVLALTGINPDRLPEEKKRGITIDLGFADMEIGDLRFGLVDVPGHERFVKNMLAGVHGIDMVLLVVAADEGVMPQTREHFEICRLLGVRNGVIAITKSDLADDEMLLLVKEEVRELVAGSFLENAPLVFVSSKTGAGLDELKTKLKEIATNVPVRSSAFVTRLPVDRAFSIKGFGPVVTGTLIAGGINNESELQLLPAMNKVRVRGIQVHGSAVSKASAGQRTAVNLGGIDVNQLGRGMVLTQVDRLRVTQMFDAFLQVLPGTARGLRSRARVRLHIGAAEVLARVRILEDKPQIAAGESGLVQIRVESPIVAVHDDHFILRSYSPAETIAGGVVLEPFASKHRKKEMSSTRQRLAELRESDQTQKLVALISGSGQHGLRVSDVAAATGWTNNTLASAAVAAKQKRLIIEANGVYLTPESFAQLGAKVIELIKEHHKREPLARGISRETLREKVTAHSSPELFTAVIDRLQESGELVSEKEIVRLKSHKVDLSGDEKLLRDRFEELYLSVGVEAPTIDDAMQRLGVKTNERTQARKILQLLIDGGVLIRIHGELFMHAQTINELKVKIVDFGRQHEPERLIDVATFKDLAGVSRKYAIPLLEYFDRVRVTSRVGDKRLILK